MRSRRSAEQQDTLERRLSLLMPPDPGDRDPDPPFGGPTRVRDASPPRLGEPVEVPLPGRHASRRWPVAPVEAVRLRLAPTHLTVLAIVVALGLALTSWWMVRSAPVPVAAPTQESPLTALTNPSSGPSLSGSAGLPAASATPGTVVVDVAGRVRQPGVVELAAGSRVIDAIEAAGGPRGGVDLSGLNLARVLVDGEQVLVGAPPVAVPGQVGTPVVPGATAPLVNLNTADLATLDSLPGVGPVTAQAIVSWREEHGGFTAVQELLEVDGIGPVTLEELAPLVTL